jgi:hypothetical protein
MILDFKPFWSNNDEINDWLKVILQSLVVLTGLRLLLDLFEKKQGGYEFSPHLPGSSCCF